MSLLFGVAFGGFFLLLIATASTGIISGDSVTIDQTLSKTPLDNGGECIDKQGQIWLSIYEDHHDLKVKSYNVPEINTAIVVSYTNIDGNSHSQVFQRGIGNLAIEIDGEDLYIGDQTLIVSLHTQLSDPSVDDSNITLGSTKSSQSSSIGVERRSWGRIVLWTIF